MSLPERSFYGGVMILAILAVRAVLLHRLPKRTFVVLWDVVLLRLLLPFSFASVFSVYTLLGAGIRQVAELPEQVRGNDVPLGGSGLAGGFDFAGMVVDLVASPDRGFVANSDRISVRWVIWVMGACLCAVVLALIYFRCLREFRTALPVKGSYVEQWLRGHKSWRPIAVRQSDRISTPLTYGILRPVILLPKKLVMGGARELQYVLQHEYVHVRHWDAVVKLVMAAAFCIHWYNPLVWLMAVMLNRDIELACDEGVLGSFGESARSDYALTLIDMGEKESGPACFYNGFSRNSIEERIRAIMRYRKVKCMAVFAAVLLVVSIAFFFMTSVQEAEAFGKQADNGELMGEGGQDMLMDPPKESMDQNDELERVHSMEEGISREEGNSKEEGNSREEGISRYAEGSVEDGPGLTEISGEELLQLPVQGGEDLSEDGKAAAQLVTAFWQAYLSNDGEILQQYLAESYTDLIEGFPDGSDEFDAASVQVNALKGLNMEEKAVGEMCTASVEFLPSGEADSYVYLTLELVKEQSGWKVAWYGLER